LKEINFYYREQCQLCDEALDILSILKNLYTFQIKMCNINLNEEWFERYHLEIPVLEAGNRRLLGNEISFQQIESYIKSLN